MAVAVTSEDLERVEAEVEAAQMALREAEREYAASRASMTAYNRHQEAVDAADQVQVRARLLREEYAAQQAVRDARAAVGEAAALDVAGDVAGLVASRRAAVEAVLDAVVVMGSALDALARHDEGVRALGEQLLGRGLISRDGEPTGAGLDGSAWVGGTLWPLVDGGSVMGRLLCGLVAERQERHPVAGLRWAPYGGVTAGRGRDEVLALVRAERGR